VESGCIVGIDGMAQKEQIRNIHNLDWEIIVDRLGRLATSEVGREQLRRLGPLTTQEAAKASVAEIGEAQSVLASGRRCFMESLDLFSLWHQRLIKGAVLKPLELKDVRHFCLETIALKETLAAFSSPWLSQASSGLMEATEPLSAIEQIMTPEGEIRADASERLYQLYNERSAQARSVQQILDQLVKKHEMEDLLQDRYVTNREGRWVLPVKSGMQHFFEGVIHASSQSKNTVFMEPKEIIPLNNRLRQVEVEIEEEIERLLAELSRYLKSQTTAFESSRNYLSHCDVRFAQAQLATQMNAVPADFSTNEIRLADVRHPLLALGSTEVVSNSVHLDKERRILLLSGPNAGGKTVLLKGIGLAAQMARCGLPICASEGSVLPFFSEVFVAVGDAQSIDSHLSTFAAHLRVLNEALSASGSNCLLLIDEICGSTDPEEGAALGRSFIEDYAKNGVFGVITSHLGPLKLGWTPGSGVVNGSLEYDSTTGRPTYQFLMGVPGQSLAILTAKRVGVAETVIERAMNHLSPDLKRYQMGLAEVENMKIELLKTKEQMERESRAAAAEKAKFQALSLKFDRDKEKMLEQTVKRAEKKIDQIIEHSRVDEVFRRHDKLEKSKFDLPEIIKASAKTASSQPRIATADDFAKAFPPGSKVFSITLSRDAVVQGMPNARGEVPILSNSMRLMAPWDELKSPQAASNPTLNVIRQSKTAGLNNVAASIDNDRTVDVRGLTVQEAIERLESELDTASVHGQSRVRVIHGHGTEALKRGVRQFLSRSLYVKTWKAGTPESGGDGITWVEIKD
jgi:DNA mismatch repair protein MutS2